MTDKISIYAALAKAQSEMGKALKSAANPHFKSKYADLSEVMDACLPALNANGIAVFQPMRETDGARYVVTILAHTGGETIECAVPLIVQKNDMQGLGSAITYARRYGLMSMAGIAPEDDDGNAAAKAAPQRETAQRQAPAPDDRAIQHAKEYIANAEKVDDVTERWKALPENVRNALAVIDAAKARKAELQAQPSIADALQDEIPHEGK